MIKVNLLKDPSSRAHKTFAKPSASSRTGLALVAFLVLVLAGMGSWYFYLNNQQKKLTETRNALRIQEARLEELQKELTKFEDIKRQKQKRIDVIEELEGKRTGPVLLMNYVLQSIPKNRLLWLTLLEQTDTRVKIVSFSQQIEAIPDFMTNLSKTGFFKSVDLETIDSQKDASRFSLLCVSAPYQTKE